MYIFFRTYYRCSTLRERSLEISFKIPIGKLGVFTLGWYIGHTGKGMRENRYFGLPGVWITRGVRVLYPYILSMFYSYIRYIF